MESPVDLERELTSGFAGYYIRRKARQLVGTAGLTAADRPDLEQELALVVFLRLPKFDPRRAHWNVFAVTVIERHAITLLRSVLAKRRNGKVASLGDGSRVEHRHLAALTGRPFGDRFAQVDLRCDTQSIVKSLPAELRCLCFDLQHDAMVEIAVRRRVSRTTIWNRMKKLRKAFRRAGFQDSCKKDETSKTQSA